MGTTFALSQWVAITPFRVLRRNSPYLIELTECKAQQIVGLFDNVLQNSSL